MSQEPSMLKYVCVVTYNYVWRAYALYASAGEHTAAQGNFLFFCIDDESAELLRALGVSSANLLHRTRHTTPEIEASRQRMTFSEYCMQFKTRSVEAVFAEHPETEWVVNVDGDMMFFADPHALFAEDRKHSAIFTEHRYSDNMRKWEAASGRLNGGVMAFRNCAESRDMLDQFLKASLARPPKTDRLGETFNQKILDGIADDFPNTYLAPDKGLNTGPWNIDDYALSREGPSILVDGEPLYLYHYQGMRFHSGGYVDLYAGDRYESRPAVDWIFRPYLDRVAKSLAAIRAVDQDYAVEASPAFAGVTGFLRLHVLSAMGRTNVVRHPALTI